MITVLRLLGWARSAFQALLALVVRYPVHCACVGLILACGWFWNAKDSAERERDEAVAAKVAQAAEFSAAVEEADRLNREARAAVESKTRELADAADDHARDLDAISRRALAGRVQGQGVCASAASVAGLPEHPEGAAGTDTGGAVAFTAAEAENLRAHEVRSTVCHGWALDLIDAGLAVGE